VTDAAGEHRAKGHKLRDGEVELPEEFVGKKDPQPGEWESTPEGSEDESDEEGEGEHGEERGNEDSDNDDNDDDVSGGDKGRGPGSRKRSRDSAEDVSNAD
jgi:hypothetical protein